MSDEGGWCGSPGSSRSWGSCLKGEGGVLVGVGGHRTGSGGPSDVAEPRCTLQELEFISASREVRRAQVHHRCPRRGQVSDGRRPRGAG